MVLNIVQHTYSHAPHIKSQLGLLDCCWCPSMQEHAFKENLAVVISLPVLELAFLAFDWENAKNLDSGFVHIF